MAHKKAQWTTNNGRDSQSQRLGVKVFGGQPVKAGGIIIRQKWNKFWWGENVSQGVDFTLFATKEGLVSFQEKRRVRFDGSIYRDIYVSVK
ncbi:MAG: 50S ribosomal protein L27 [uncultured bacterium (gcode 4)]|uniref:Large ribosomal subunit protein bL27 n=1 Tax=uncultured bacterium (gcode 4) TaxID=1234023 RepID=K2BCC9_9BACT|nr:MAG: 50S ribosomal protein L27 [uncultured bacterium (gcode 4)]